MPWSSTSTHYIQPNLQRGLSRSAPPHCILKKEMLCALADQCLHTNLRCEGMLLRGIQRCSAGWRGLDENLKNKQQVPGGPSWPEREGAGPADLHEKRHSLGRESGAG